MNLYCLCEHGEKGKHYTGPTFHKYCPGGRPATPEDLIEALGGEKVWWCLVHNDRGNPNFNNHSCWKATVGDSDYCRMVVRILTPALDQEKET